MPDEKWVVDSLVPLYRYSFSNEFEGNVKADVVSAIVRKTRAYDTVYLELDDVKTTSYLYPEDLGVPKSGKYYIVVLDEDDLELAKKLVLDSMSERIDRLRKGIEYTQSRMQDVLSAKV